MKILWFSNPDKCHFMVIGDPNYTSNHSLFGSKNTQSVRFGVDAMAFFADQLWQKVPIAIKNYSSTEIFKAKIKLYNCQWKYPLTIA